MSKSRVSTIILLYVASFGKLQSVLLLNVHGCASVTYQMSLIRVNQGDSPEFLSEMSSLKEMLVSSSSRMNERTRCFISLLSRCGV